METRPGRDTNLGEYTSPSGQIVEPFCYLGMTTLTTDERAINMGVQFIGEDTLPNIAKNAHYLMCITTPGEEVTYRVRSMSIGKTGTTLEISMMEDASIVEGSPTEIVPYNLNRRCAEDSSLTIKKGITSYTGGTIVKHNLLYGDRRESVKEGVMTELILKPSTTYVLDLHNIGGAAATNVFFAIMFREDTLCCGCYDI